MMRAMVLESPHTPLRFLEVPIPLPQEGEVLLKVHACAVCRTDLHISDGELSAPHYPLILGHQVVGTVVRQGAKTSRFQLGERVGVPWLGKTCGTCPFCLTHRENLCDNASFTGYHLNGGYAEYCVASENYCHPLPEAYADIHVAPLLCGGLIGLRALRMAGEAQKIGFYGFGSSAHILLQVALYQGKEVYVFTRPQDEAAQLLAKQLGATWVGSSEERPPDLLDAALIFAPVGALIPQALASSSKGASVICAGIHMSDIPSFPYKLLHEERILRSVAHLTREDGKAFFEIATEHPLHTEVTTYPLEKANQALQDLREGKVTGSAVLVLTPS